MTARRIASAAVALCAALTMLCSPAAAQSPALPILPAPSPVVPAPPPPTAPPAGGSVLDGDAMWIWLLYRSDGGNLDSIAARARRNGIELVILKGADGRTRWRQISPALVRALHARGLRVCGYQFVYGRRPLSEARTGVRLARTGLDCLMIDAEGAYEGHYVAAQTYMRHLRSRLGPAYPIGLTSFPYVHYHPGLPYSVFLGPGGAQFNLPQMYWRAIGTSVGRIFSVTYRHNRVYGRPIYPLGQVYSHPPAREIRRFRALAAARKATGVSWWSWQAAGERDFRAVGAAFNPLPPPPDDGWPVLGPRARGDLVVWAQQHLLSAGKPLRVTGTMSRATRAALAAFQTERGLLPTANVDAPTWQALLSLPAAPVLWRKRGYAVAAGRGQRGTAAGSRPRSSHGTPEPLSARLPARMDELRGRPGG